ANFLEINEQAGVSVERFLHDFLEKKVSKPGIYPGDFFEEWINQCGYSFNRVYLNKLNIFDMCEEICRIFKLSGKHNPFVEFFLDTILDYSEKKTGFLDDFLDWWYQAGYKKSIILPEETDAVRVMTIHKAKGLQFPVVIYPFANERLKLTNPDNWLNIDLDVTKGLENTLVRFDDSLSKTIFKDNYEKEKNKSLLDLLNLVYVCLTRPTDRLYVLTAAPPKTRKEINSVPLFFYYYLNNIKIWSESRNVYEFGEPGYPGEKAATSGQMEFSFWFSSPWYKRLSIGFRSPVKWEFEVVEKKEEWGKLVHTVLSEIKTQSDTKNVVDGLFNEGLINQKEQKQLIDDLTKVLSNEKTGEFFKKDLHIRAETEIIDADGNSHRPDRLIFNADEVIVIDFKTGVPLEKHKKEIKHYGSLLCDMGYKQIRKYLLYIYEENPLVEVV
ncbi:MAG: PD-(D/E)XK nuclease family protein, partial [Bacteroidales bacterium]|nr:PD-(D/E)XK nuclease family protein [Bacteroidales bacterium]